MKRGFFTSVRDLTLLVFLRRGGPLRARDIAEDVLLERSQASNIVRRMVNTQLLRSAGKGPRNSLRDRGRSPEQFALTHAGLERLCELQSPDWTHRALRARGIK